MLYNIKTMKMENALNNISLFPVQTVCHRQIFYKSEDCYFCLTNILGCHYRTGDRIEYINVLSASKLVPRESQVRQATSKKPNDSPVSFVLLKKLQNFDNIKLILISQWSSLFRIERTIQILIRT